MKLPQSLLTAVVVVAILAIVAAVVATVLNAIELARAPTVAQRAMGQDGQGTQQQSQGAATDRVVVLSPEPASRWSRFWFGDPWNRDPVCGGDPLCRDAYFRDWPYARRPSHPHPPRSDAPATLPQPINITNTATSNVYPPPPPPSQATPQALLSQSSADAQAAAQTPTQAFIATQTAAQAPAQTLAPQASQTTTGTTATGWSSEGSQGAQLDGAPATDGGTAESGSEEVMPLTEDTAGSPLRAAACNTCARKKKFMAGLLRN